LTISISIILLLFNPSHPSLSLSSSISSHCSINSEYIISKWVVVLRKSVSLVNMVPVMVPPSESKSRRSKLPNTLPILAPSAVSININIAIHSLHIYLIYISIYPVYNSSLIYIYHPSNYRIYPYSLPQHSICVLILISCQISNHSSISIHPLSSYMFQYYSYHLNIDLINISIRIHIIIIQFNQFSISDNSVNPSVNSILSPSLCIDIRLSLRMDISYYVSTFHLSLIYCCLSFPPFSLSFPI
jgi:hypothetical protein